MARTDPQVNIRMPDELKDAIAERAKANGRSMNSEIVQILQDALDFDRDVNDSELCFDYQAARGEKPLSLDFKRASRKLILALEEFDAVKNNMLKGTHKDE